MDIYNVGVDDQLSILRTVSEPVKEIDDNLVDFAKSMLSYLEKNGIGLAAPQVGRNERFFVVQLEVGQPYVFFNPEILETSQELSTYEEGCLSIPGFYANVKRPAFVKIQAYNLRGRPFTMEAEGLMATCIQHEFDHLNGKLFIDYLGDRKRERVIKKMHEKAGKK